MEGISWPQPSAASKVEAAQNGEFRALSAVRAVGWELEGQEVNT